MKKTITPSMAQSHQDLEVSAPVRTSLLTSGLKPEWIPKPEGFYSSLE